MSVMKKSRNPVARYAKKFNKSSVHTDRKKDAKKGAPKKHKETYDDK